jgi:hypothetical protein
MLWNLFTPRRRPTRRPSARLFCEALEDRLVPMTIPVTTAADSGPGSLRQAIQDANVNPDLGEIHFQIVDANSPGVHTIHLASPLPNVTHPVLIDGTTQPEYPTAKHPVIELDCTAGGNYGLMFSKTSGGSTVRGLAINRFSDFGIGLYGDDNNIEGNYIGTDATGTFSLSRFESWGLDIHSGHNHVGGGGSGPAQPHLRQPRRYRAHWPGEPSAWQLHRHRFHGDQAAAERERGGRERG